LIPIVGVGDGDGVAIAIAIDIAISIDIAIAIADPRPRRLFQRFKPFPMLLKVSPRQYTRTPTAAHGQFVFGSMRTVS